MSGQHKVGMSFLLFLLFLTPVQNRATASDLPGSLSHRAEIIHFQNQLNQNLTQEEHLKKKLREIFMVAARPQAEYLLYQKSLGIADLSSRLTQLKEERRDIIKQITRLEGKPLTASFLLGLENFSSPRFYPTYSGAPLLSFNNLHDSEAGTMFQLPPSRAGLFQGLTVVFFLLVVSLPLIAIYKSKQKYTGKEVVRVFPIFTVQTDKGHRDLFKMAA